MDYYQESVEPSYLYLRNRFMQYAHARCLAEELEMLGIGGRKKVPGRVSWPDGFSEKLDFAYPGSPSARPREYDQIFNVGGDQPHFNYPLRNIAEEIFTVGRSGPVGSIRRIEQLSLQQAVREAFPGAIYLSQARGWRVQEWRNTAFERTIRVEAAGDNWDMVYWNPKTDECRESFDESPEHAVRNDLGPSPYIVGNPVDQEEMFFGRAVIMDKIKRQLCGSNHSNVILLEGNRRTGKTSILRQLSKKETLPGWVPVYCSLQDVDSIATADVFRLLMLRTGWTLADVGIETGIPGMPRPGSGESFKLSFRSALDRAFSDGRPFETLEIYLSAAIEAANPLRILLMLDEFDKLQDGIDRGKTTCLLLDHLRAVGDFGQHLDDYPDTKVTVGFGAAAILAAISLTECLTADLQQLPNDE